MYKKHRNIRGKMFEVIMYRNSYIKCINSSNCSSESVEQMKSIFAASRLDQIFTV